MMPEYRWKRWEMLLCLALFCLSLITTTANGENNDNGRPRRVNSQRERNNADYRSTSPGQTRTSVNIKRRRKHGVIYRGAAATGKGTVKTAKVVGKGTAKGASTVGKAGVDGSIYAGKKTAKGAKVAGHATMTAGKAVVNAFR